jgi:dipeptidyl aminopeptidase/acylaminoacyl peptidase
VRRHAVSVFVSSVLVSFMALSRSARADNPGGVPVGPVEGQASSLAAGPGTPGRPWESSKAAALSADGRWFACTISAGSDRVRLLVRDTDGRRRREVVGARDAAFAADSKSLIYSTAAPEGLDYVVRDLETWTTKRSLRLFPESVTATPDARYLVIKGPKGMTGRDAGGRPAGENGVIIYSLMEDKITAIGPASFHKLSGDGQFVALARAGPGGLTFLDVLRLGETEPHRVLEIRGEFSALAWGDDHRSLALVIAQDQADGETADLLVAVDDATAKTPRVRSVLLEEHAAWPKGAYLDPDSPQVGAAGAVVYFRVLNATAPSPRRRRDSDPEIHRSADGIIYDSATDSVQERATGASWWWFAWIPEDGRMIKVADLGQTSVIPLRGGRTVLVSPSGWDRRNPAGRPAGWDLVDPRAGSRTSLGWRPVTGVSPSRTGRYVAYLDRGHWWAFDTSDNSRSDLTVGFGPAFVADLSIDVDAGGPIGEHMWLDADCGLIAHDSHDAWLLRPDGTAPQRMTRGRERDRVFRLATTLIRDDTPGFRFHPDYFHAPGGQHYFHVVETRSKHSGYVRVGSRGDESIIAFGPWAVGGLTKARDAERFIFERESYDAPPNIFTAIAQGDYPLPMSEMNEGRSPLARYRRELIQYQDGRGTALQSILIYPVGYDPSKKYPMVVWIYTKFSDDFFRFRRPASEGDVVPPNDESQGYASRGYFVLLPDIEHQPREVGPSAVDCVEAAVRAVLRSGVVEPGRIGLMGGSLGGYETAFVLTKSKLFAAGVAFSLPGDWASQLLTGWGGSVNADAEDVFRSIGMPIPFWEDPDSYVANSLLYHAHGITAPLLIGVGRRDHRVDCRDGESLFNLLRYLKRPAYLVAYPRSGHWLGEDFNRRAQQFFDHYLKREAPPDWIAGHDHH